ncbi:MAG TPA: hypothetical protein PLK12_14845 [Prolixibacteraceae bacterium]|nr:hypothetical protein [Prolixibacteraceae bacterium]
MNNERKKWDRLAFRVAAFFVILLFFGCDKSETHRISDSSLNTQNGEILRVILHYGDALNVDGGGWYSVKLINPLNEHWDDQVIISRDWNAESVTEEEYRILTFSFFRKHFMEQWNYLEYFKPKYDETTFSQILAGDYDLIITNSFAYSKTYKEKVRVYYYRDRSDEIVINPGVIDISVP